jgi:hypothetical protein
LGPEYTKYLLKKMDAMDDPSLIVDEVKTLEMLGTISEVVGESIINFLKVSKNKKVYI